MISASQGDAHVLSEIGRRIEQHRLHANLTQAALAREAGVSKRTVERLEASGACQLSSLVRVLRALGLLDGLELALPAPPPSPMALLRTAGATRQRASPRAAPPAGEVADREPWQWDPPPEDDER